MFKPVCDYVKSSSELLPFGDHPTLFRSCAHDFHSSFQEALQEANLSQDEKQKAEKVCTFVEHMYEMFLEKAGNPSWSALTKEERQAHIEALCARPQVEQRTEAWYKQTANVLTASEFSTLFSSPAQRNTLVQSKVNCVPKEYLPRLAFPSSEIKALTWGIRFEPVVKQMLEKQWGVHLRDLGRISHPTDSHLAASPDALIIGARKSEQLGRLVEIKCPFSRKVGGEIPFDYWVQMQIQMECTDIDECEYIEVEILSTRADRPAPTLQDLSGCSHTGLILLWRKGDEYDYEYLPLDVEYPAEPVKEGWELAERIPWGVQKYHHKLVQRDRVWFQSTDIWRQAFWRDVEQARLAPPVEKLKICLIKDE